MSEWLRHAERNLATVEKLALMSWMQVPIYKANIEP